MPEENAPAEELKPAAPDASKQEGVKEAPAPEPTEAELALATANAKIARLTQERDNYRQMGIKYKRAQKDGEQPDDEERIRQIAREEFMNTQIAQADAEKDAIIVRMAKENSELKIAIKNRSQILTAGGSSQGAPEEEKKTPWTKEQLDDLKKMELELGVKIDPAKAYENWLKQKNK